MFSFVLLSCALLQASAQTPVPEEDIGIEGSLVLDVNPEELDSMIEQATQENHLSLLVNFFAPWCGHCKNLAPQYSEIASELKSSVLLAKIDCVEHKEYCVQKHITHYPTLYFYHPHSGKNGEEYPGNTDGMLIRNWVTMHFAEPCVDLDEDTSTEIDETGRKRSTGKNSKVAAFVAEGRKENQLVLIGRISDAKELLGFYKAWVSQLFLNSKPNKFRFGFVTAASPNYINSVTLYTPFDAKKFETEFTKNVDLNVWLKNRELPLCAEITPQKFDLYKEQKLPLVLIFLSRNSGNFNGWLSEIKPIAEENRGKFLFAWLDMDKYKEVTFRLGVTTNLLPGVVMSNLETRKHYPLHVDYSQDSLRQHCKLYLQNKLTSLSRTQLRPSPDRYIQETLARNSGTNGTGIQDVYANTWDTIVKDPTKTVLVFFDAHWCKECRLLRDKYPQVADYYRNRSDVVIATIDVSANEGDFVVPEVMPGLTLFPADNKAGIPYVAGRDLAELKFFIDQKLEEFEKKRGGKEKPSAILPPVQDIEFPEHDEI